MVIIKSRTFVVKLALLLPLSYFSGFVALLLTGGGHGNNLPWMIMLGPLNVMVVREFDLSLFTYIVTWGVAYLYGMYALLIHFIKFGKTVRWVLGFHLASTMITMPFLICQGLVLLVGDRTIYGVEWLQQTAIILFADITYCIPFIIVIWILVSMRRQIVDVDKDTNNDIDSNTIKNQVIAAKLGKSSIGCYCAILFVFLLSSLSYRLGLDFFSYIVFATICFALSLSGFMLALRGIVKKETPKAYSIVSLILNALVLLWASSVLLTEIFDVIVDAWNALLS